jgi:glyoxylase-like metal-dependent hydrolase (beta-lactamase superfamily II)
LSRRLRRDRRAGSAQAAAPDNAAKIDALLAKNFQTNPAEVSINAFLIAMPGHKILVDTGSGQLFGPGNGGRLIESLATQGIKPEDITEVLLTHAHSDHAGGLVKDGKVVFSNARFRWQTGRRLFL